MEGDSAGRSESCQWVAIEIDRSIIDEFARLIYLKEGLTELVSDISDAPDAQAFFNSRMAECGRPHRFDIPSLRRGIARRERMMSAPGSDRLRKELEDYRRRTDDCKAAAAGLERELAQLRQCTGAELVGNCQRAAIDHTEKLSGLMDDFAARVAAKGEALTRNCCGFHRRILGLLDNGIREAFIRLWKGVEGMTRDTRDGAVAVARAAELQGTIAMDPPLSREDRDVLREAERRHNVPLPSRLAAWITLEERRATGTADDWQRLFSAIVKAVCARTGASATGDGSGDVLGTVAELEGALRTLREQRAPRRKRRGSL